MLADHIGPHKIMWATDCPHRDGFFPGAPQMLRDRLGPLSPKAEAPSPRRRRDGVLRLAVTAGAQLRRFLIVAGIRHPQRLQLSSHVRLRRPGTESSRDSSLEGTVYCELVSETGPVQGLIIRPRFSGVYVIPGIVKRYSTREILPKIAPLSPAARLRPPGLSL